MNDLAETKKFFDDLMSGNYEVFDFSNPMRNVPTRTSYHIKKTEEDKIIKELFKSRLIMAVELSDVAMRKLSKNENEYRTLKILNVLQQNVFLPIVVSERFISVYELYPCPSIGFVDLNTEVFSKRFHVPVLGYERTINENSCAEPDTIKYFMQLETEKGVRQRYVRDKDTDRVENMDISVFCECYDLSQRKAEVEELFQKEPDDAFDGIAGLLGVSTWFPRDLTNYKLEKTRKNIRLYRRAE
ncbi:hypothetical protein [Clostridium sp. AN503]|uniref:hypothetical protein n=1 Tax=Clostridium sp. AN503 TaxID=3160598 RepID=UPI003459264E